MAVKSGFTHMYLMWRIVKLCEIPHGISAAFSDEEWKQKGLVDRNAKM